MSRSSICSWWATATRKRSSAKPRTSGSTSSAALPEGGADLIRRLLANVCLKEHLHGKFRATCGGLRRSSGTALGDLAAEGSPSRWPQRLLRLLVAGLEPGAVQRLLQVFGRSGTPKAWGNAGFLLRLADAAGYFVVDGLVMGRFAAQEGSRASRWRPTLPAVARARAAAGYLPTRRERVPLQGPPALRPSAAGRPAQHRAAGQ